MKKFAKIIASLLLFAMLITVIPSVSLPVFAKNAKNDYDFTGLYLTREQIRLKVGGSYTLIPREIGLSGETVTWSSADESVATVTSLGEMVGHKVGKTVITAKKDGYSAKCTVLVGEKDPAMPTHRLTIPPFPMILQLPPIPQLLLIPERAIPKRSAPFPGF